MTVEAEGTFTGGFHRADLTGPPLPRPVIVTTRNGWLLHRWKVVAMVATVSAFEFDPAGAGHCDLRVAVGPKVFTGPIRKRVERRAARWVETAK